MPRRQLDKEMMRVEMISVCKAATTGKTLQPCVLLIDVSLVQMKQKKFFLFAASMDSEQVRAIGAQDLSSQEQVALFADQVSGVTTVARFAEIQQEPHSGLADG